MRARQRLEAAIRAQAYLLSERAGHPPGKEVQFWLQAEEMVLAGSHTAESESAVAKIIPVIKSPKRAKRIPARKVAA